MTLFTIRGDTSVGSTAKDDGEETGVYTFAHISLISKDALMYQLLADGIWLLLLVALFVFFWRVMINLKEHRQWPITKGRIISIDWGNGVQALPHVEYSYQVEGNDFTSSTLLAETQYSLHSRYAQDLIYRITAAYEKKHEIDVYYNPDDPRQAVLDIRMPRKLILILGLLLFFIVLHLSVMIGRLLT